MLLYYSRLKYLYLIWDKEYFQIVEFITHKPFRRYTDQLRKLKSTDDRYHKYWFLNLLKNLPFFISSFRVNLWKWVNL